jgi:intracellular septation protein
MKEGLWHLLDDLAAAVLFLVTYAVSGRLDVAVCAVLLFAAVPVLLRVLLRRRIGPLRWLSLGLVLALGGAASLAGSPRFMMARPSAVHFVLAAAMLRKGWLFRYLNSTAQRDVPRGLITAAGYGWAVLMAALGLTNLFIALYFDLRIWGWFVAAVSPAAKIAALSLQYAVFRTIRRRQLATGDAGLHSRSTADIRRGSRGARAAPRRGSAPTLRVAEQNAQAQDEERCKEAFRSHRRRPDQAELGP